MKKIVKKIIMVFIKKFNKLIPDKLYLKLFFRARMDQRLNLKNPKTFSEKLQWLKLYNKDPQHTNYVDKYEVRELIKECIGEEYLIPMLGIYNNIEEIDFDLLPNQFVLKCTHDSGGVVICRDKNNFDTKDAKDKLSAHLKKNFFYHGREFCYKNVPPRIICEQYMMDGENEYLKDYKFMCFNGKVKCSFVCLNRNSDKGLNVDFYDLDWKIMPFERKYPNSGETIPKPKNYKKMIEMAEEISKNMIFARIDFYEIGGKVYFGEITLYPGNGAEQFMPVEYDYILGSWLELPIDI